MNLQPEKCCALRQDKTMTNNKGHIIPKPHDRAAIVTNCFQN